MSENASNNGAWAKIARDGTFAILLSYMIYFLANTVVAKLDKQTEILEDILVETRKNNELHQRTATITSISPQ